MILDKANIISYDINTIKNIIINIPSIYDQIKSKIFIEQYVMNPVMRPDELSQKLYNSPHYEWTLLLINDIIDPFWGWPQHDEVIQELAEHKYSTDPNGYNGIHHHYDPQIETDLYYDLIEYPNTSKLFYNINDVFGTTDVDKISDKDLIKLQERYGNYYKFSEDEEGDNPYYLNGSTIIIPRPWFPQFVGNLVPVTNLEYELSENENKKTINVIPAESIRAFSDYITNVMNKYGQ
jgi:hypothetical protein